MNRKKIIVIGAILIIILIVIVALVLRSRNQKKTPAQTPTQPAQSEQPIILQTPSQDNLPPGSSNESTFDYSQSEQQIEAQKEKFLDMIYKKYPILNYLPYESDHFAIDYGPEVYGSNNYVFYIKTIYAMSEIDQIDVFRQQALDWIKSKGTDPDSLIIAWE